MRLKPSYPRLRQDHPLANGLAGAWALTEGGGLAAMDASGNAHHGTLVNGPTWEPGHFGPSVSFDGTNDYINVGKLGEFSLNLNRVTSSVWFRTTSTAIQRLFGTLNTTTAEAFFSLAINFNPSTGANQTGKFQMFVRAHNNNNFSFGFDGDAGFTDGDWHNITCVSIKNTSTAQIYVDGKPLSVTYRNTTKGTNFYPFTRDMFIGAANFGSIRNPSNGQIGSVQFYQRTLSPSEVEESYADPFAMFRPRQRSYFAFTEVAGTTYTLTCDTGSFTLTGIDANLNANRLLTADVGSFDLTGQDADLLANRSLTTDVGEFTLTGIDAGLIVSRRLTADVGEFALTGIDVGLLAGRLLDADVGSFALTGINANLLANRLLGADVGEFILTGIAADLTYSGAAGPTYTLTCEAGSFTLTGIDTGLQANRLITADVGSFALTGIDAAVLANRLITAEVGAFTLTGIDAAFVVNRRLTADTGAFVLTGIGVGLNYSGATSSTSSMYYYLMMSS